MKLIMMRGLPGSGKTTKARELMKGGNYIRLNKDELREMLHVGHWTGEKEKITKGIEYKSAQILLRDNQNVIIDDTNLREKDEVAWHDIAKKNNATFEIIDVDTDVYECLSRDVTRTKRVGYNVIMKMALKSRKYKARKKFVLVDIDGTLADIQHRKHFVEQDKKDWKSFFEAMSEDTLRESTVKLVEEALVGYEIWLVSGRPNTYRSKTIQWMKKNGIMQYFTGLIMRDENDKRPDTDTKRDIMHCFGVENIEYVIDDRPSVIRMWRENGIKVIDVGNGTEF